VKTLTLTFELERETKNTVRYQETSKAPAIGTLYVQKLALGEEYPGKLTMTLEVAAK
jgi:hypothetical protein